MFKREFNFVIEPGFIATVDNCIKKCQEEGYIYAGVQFSGQCFCGDTFPDSQKYPKKDEAECNMPCLNNLEEKCGGFFRNNVYETGN